MDFSKLFPNLKKISEKELKDKEKSLFVGDHVRVVKNIRCIQAGKSGVITKINPEDKYGWKSFVVKFDDSKYGSMAFQSGNLNKTAGDYGTKRSLKGLLKLASLVKKADPPGKGLNSKNPITKAVYRRYGYVPQATGSYLYSDSGPNFIDALDTAFDAADNLDLSDTQLRAALFDLTRSAGGIGNQFIPGTSNSPPAIVVGSYPYDNETSFRHEQGHLLDPALLASERTDPKAVLRKEEKAWDLSGVSKGDPIREAALASYRAYAKDGLSSPDIPKATTNYWNAILPSYNPLHTWINSYTNNVPMIIHDMPSAEKAISAGVHAQNLGL